MLSESVRMCAQNLGPAPYSEHSLVQPRASQWLARFWIQEYAVILLGVAPIAFDLERK